MTTAEYRDEISSLGYSISNFKATVNFAERSDAAERLARAWKRLALLEQPKRLQPRDSERCQRFLAQAATLLNDWKVNVDAGVAQDLGTNVVFPAQAMQDTMRFCESMKRKA